MQKKTQYQPVVSLHGGHRHIRPVHLERVDYVRIGTMYNGDPVWSSYPAKKTLCRVKDLMGAAGEPTCTRCIKLRDQEIAAGKNWNPPPSAEAPE